MDEDTGLAERLKQLQSRRGPDLVAALADEIALLHRQTTELRREVAALADFRGSRWLARHAPGGEGPALPRAAIIEADQHLGPRDGFYPLEYTSAGVPFRWTGPSPNFFFEVYVDRTRACDLTLDALSFIDFEAQKDIKLMADAEAVPVRIETGESGFHILATLPPRGDRFATNLVFILPKAMPPREGSDTRPLGLAFSRLSIGPHAGSKGAAVSAAADEDVFAEPAT